MNRKVGIDVSDNVTVDWAKAGLSGVMFAVLRSVRRSGKEDFQFAANIAGCRLYGILVQIYKYTYATTVEAAILEAQQVVALAQKYGFKGKVWWDVEDRDTLYPLGKTLLTQCILAAQQVIEAAGLEFGIYTGEYVYREQWFDFSQFTCDLWGARWPAGNTEVNYGWIPDESLKPNLGREISGWQFSSRGLLDGISGYVDLDVFYDVEKENIALEEGEITEAQIRQKIVDCAMEWIDCKEFDGSHKAVIDVYNSYAPLARGYKVQYTDSWCATFVSAVSIMAGYTDIVPTECSCGKMIALYQKMNRWQEDDSYVPNTGDIIFYDWEDSGVGDNAGWADHVGIVVSVKDNAIRVIEGNLNDAVGYRTVSVNSNGIRGYALPDYASKATAISMDTQPKEGLVYANIAGFTPTEAACVAFHDFLAAHGMNTENWIVQPIKKI